MTEHSIKEPRWLDLKGSMEALRRAALRAREEAIRTHTDLIQVRDGKMVRISPAQEAEVEKP